MLQVGIFTLLLTLSLYGMWNVYAAIPSFGKARIIGIPFAMYHIVLGCFYLVMVLDGPAVWVSYWMAWPLWLDLTLQTVAVMGIIFLFVRLRTRQTFNRTAYWDMMTPALPLLSASVIKIFARLFG